MAEEKVINFELLDTVHKFIKNNPQYHNQAMFANGVIESGAEIVDQASANECGTTLCFAGWTAILAGHYQMRLGSDYEGHVVNPANGQIRHMSDVASDELGFNPHQAIKLFYECQSMKEVDNYIDRLHSIQQ